MLRDFAERGKTARVALDRDDAARAEREKRAGEPAGTGADFDNGRVLERCSRPRDAGGEIEVEQKILAERFACRKTMTADDVAQRRQVVDHAHRAGARRAASRRAATRLDESARPVPAISNAVP